MKLTNKTKNSKQMLLSILILLPMFAIIGCSKDDPPPIGPIDDDNNHDDNTIVTVVEVDPGDTPDAMLVPNSKAINALGLSNPLVITFTEGQATTTGGANASATVTGSNVDVTLSGNDANIVLQGVSTTGSVSISGDYNCKVHLNGVGITAANSAALINNGSGIMNINIIDGTANRLIDNTASDDKATVYSDGDLNVTGGGTLEVRGNVGHTIATDGKFAQTAGNIWAKSAKKDGVNAKSITISGGSFKARVIGDGLQGDDFLTVTGGELSIITTADDKKANALKSDGNIEISGTPKIKAIVYGTASKCISSDGNLTITGGNFTLQTAGNGFWDETEAADDKTSACAAIKCDGDLNIKGGSFSILSAGTGGKGISVDGNITIDGGTFKVATTGEIYTYSAAYDTKPKAIKSDNNIVINGGNFYIKTFTEYGEGIEGEYSITVNDGYFEIETCDDAINVSGGINENSGKIIINGGKIYCNSSNNDGVDCNGTITVTGGLIVSYGSYDWQEGFDCDANNFTITGGTLVGIGMETAYPTLQTSTSCIMNFDLDYSELYYVKSADGEEVMALKILPPPSTYKGRICILFSSSKLAVGTECTLYSGGSLTGGADFHGLYTGTDYTQGDLGIVVETFKAAKYVSIHQK